MLCIITFTEILCHAVVIYMDKMLDLTSLALTAGLSQICHNIRFCANLGLRKEVLKIRTSCGSYQIKQAMIII